MRESVYRQRRTAVRRGLRAVLLAAPFLLAGYLAGCDPASANSGPGARDDAARRPSAQAAVRPGVEVLLADSLHLVRGRRVGLVTNHTGIDTNGTSAIDLLHDHPEVELVALFSPEHGIRGALQAGVEVSSGIDDRTGLPIHSLYGETRRPNAAMLDGLDVVLFDIQDVGARYYTYVYTMALSMEASGEAGIPFIVLDRPNPIGGQAVQGAMLDPAFATFVGMYPVPMRHGMTPGELARLFVGEFGVVADLTVVPAEGWTRDMSFQETGLPWVPPSPNMPSVESALHYPGTCLFEGTNLSVGRGTDEAFRIIGAPWLDSGQLLDRLAGYELPGVEMEPVTFTPRSPGDRKYDGTAVHGLRLTATGPEYDPTRTAVALLVEARALAGDDWAWRESHFDRLAGSDALRLGVESGASVEQLTDGWAEVAARFRTLR